MKEINLGQEKTLGVAGHEVRVNKYSVKMYEADGNMRKSNIVMARSEFEAIDKVRDDPWWYDEGKGYDHKAFKWPLTFKAELWNK